MEWYHDMKWNYVTRPVPISQVSKLLDFLSEHGWECSSHTVAGASGGKIIGGQAPEPLVSLLLQKHRADNETVKPELPQIGEENG